MITYSNKTVMLKEKKMRKLIAGLLLVGFTTVVYAQCRTNTITTPDGTIVCTTCCYQGNCNTTCY